MLTNYISHILFTASISIANIAHSTQMMANLKTKKAGIFFYKKNAHELHSQFKSIIFFSGDKAFYFDFVERKKANMCATVRSKIEFFVFFREII